MDEPIYKREGPDHVLSLDGAVLTFSRLYDSREEIAGMLRVSLRGFPGREDGDIFGDSRVILTGSRSKQDAAKACKDRIAEMDWMALIEKCCQIVRRKLEEGEPPINLGTVTVPEQLPWLMEPLFRDGEHAMLYGPGGSAKSLLTLAVLACLEHGAGYIGFPVYYQYRTIFVDYEDTWETHASRLSLLTDGLQMGPRPEILHKEGTAPLHSMTGSLSRTIAQEGIAVGVIDSAGAACGSDPESADAALTYFRGLRALGLRSSITIAHHSKIDDSMPFGSVYWWNSMRNIWLARVAHKGENELHLGLFHKKANNGQLQNPLGLHITFSAEGTVIEREDVRNVEDFAKHMSQRDQIVSAIRNFSVTERRGPTREELHELTGIARASLRTVLNRMKSDITEVSGQLFLVQRENVG